MKKILTIKNWLILGLVLIAFGIVMFAMNSRPTEPMKLSFIEPNNPTQILQGKAIYANYCAACHGASLEGQANWRNRLANGRLPAPPHDETGHTWHHADEVLFDIVKNGLVPGKTAPPGYESDMPAYRDILKDEDIIAILAYIKSQWPAEALKIQKEITLQNQ